MVSLEVAEAKVLIFIFKKIAFNLLSHCSLQQRMAWGVGWFSVWRIIMYFLCSRSLRFKENIWGQADSFQNMACHVKKAIEYLFELIFPSIFQLISGRLDYTNRGSVGKHF